MSEFINPKNILLIIDPQKDFTDAPNGTNGGKGSLAVTNSSNDYKNIVDMLDKVKFDEIHVSLDTHTPQHIGHPSFWKQANEESIPDSIFVLDIVNDVITGKDILNKDAQSITVVPKEDNENLLKYVKEYLNWFNTEENTHGQRCYIWFNHCIENNNGENEGHAVAEPLKTKLDDNKLNVTYHIKGQNNLAEMYSIFKAEKPVRNEDAKELKDFIYAGGVNETEGENAKTYDEVKMMKNLKTELNTDLLKKLLGTPENQNTVYICGEARTHCVKSSAIDLLEYVEINGYDQQKVVLIKNASSPILFAPNDILRKMTGSSTQADEVEFANDEQNLINGEGDPTFTDYKFTESYKKYNAKAMTTDEIIQLLKNENTNVNIDKNQENYTGGRNKTSKKSKATKKSKKSKATKKSKKSSKTTRKHRKTHRSKR